MSRVSNWACRVLYQPACACRVASAANSYADRLTTALSLGNFQLTEQQQLLRLPEAPAAACVKMADQLEEMGYRELQQLCRELGLKASG